MARRLGTKRTLLGPAGEPWSAAELRRYLDTYFGKTRCAATLGALVVENERLRAQLAQQLPK